MHHGWPIHIQLKVFKTLLKPSEEEIEPTLFSLVSNQWMCAHQANFEIAQSSFSNPNGLGPIDCTSRWTRLRNSWANLGYVGYKMGITLWIT